MFKVKLLNLVMATILFFSSSVFAECDYSKVVSNTDGTYTYSKELHICVGRMKQDLLISQEKVDSLNKAIDFKNLALDASQKRTDLWMDTSFRLEDRLTKIQQLEKSNNWIYFGLGILTVFAVGYTVSQTYKR